MKTTVVKEMPAVPEIEKFVINQIISHNKKYHVVSKMLRPEMFYKPAYKLLYGEIQRMNGEGVTSISLMPFALSNDIDIMEILQGDIVIDEALTKPIEYFAAVIVEYHIKREAILLSVRLNQHFNHPQSDVFEHIEKAKNELNRLTNYIPKSGITTMESGVKKYTKEASEYIDRKDKKLPKVEYGFECMNNFCGGDDIGDLVLLAGERSQGKTSFAMSNMFYAAQNNPNYKAAIISLEMTETQSICRFISYQTGIELRKIKGYELDCYEWDRYHNSIDELINKQLFFVYSNSDYQIIKENIYELIRKHGVQLIFVDYINKIKTKHGYNSKKFEVYGEIAAELQDIAKAENIVIWLGMQLNKDRDNRVPEIDRLREGGQAADVADTIMFVYRPEFYSRDARFTDNYVDGQSEIDTTAKAQILRAKGRNSGTTSHILNFRKELTLFSEYDYSENDKFFPEQDNKIIDF